MTIKFVDQDTQEFDEWGYICLSGEVEIVGIDKGWCSATGIYEYYLEINDSIGGVARVYVKDVPKLIKAMEESIASIKEE